MKIDRETIFLKVNSEKEEEIYMQAIDTIKQATSKVVWPLGNDEFTINPIRKGNGVKPIKEEFVKFLKSKGWAVEESSELVDGLGTGPIDAMLETEIGKIAVEWETGNISSSHRALNKMALALMQGNIAAGFLIIPIRKLARYLTDRIGNYEEIEPYFQLWKNLPIKKGILGIIGTDYDKTSETVKVIPKGADGNSKKKKIKKRAPKPSPPKRKKP